MRTIGTRLGAAAAVTVLATGGVLATAASAGAATGHHPKPRLERTSLTIKNRYIAHAKHHADAITGVLTADRKAVSGETITLETRSGKHPRWAADGTATTSSTGSVTFTVAPTVKSQFKLVFAGDTTFAKSTSSVITLRPVRQPKK